MTRRMLTLITAAIAAAALLAVPAVAGAKATITMSGSTSVFPLASKLASAYVKAYPGAAGFRLLQGGSDIGVNDAPAGA